MHRDFTRLRDSESGSPKETLPKRAGGLASAQCPACGETRCESAGSLTSVAFSAASGGGVEPIPGDLAKPCGFLSGVDTVDLARSPSSVAIQAAPPECSAISRPTGDVAEPSDGHDRSEAGASALAIAAGQNAGGRWGEGRCPGFTYCWQVNGVQAASSARQSFGVVNQTVGDGAWAHPGKGRSGPCAPPREREEVLRPLVDRAAIAVEVT